MSTLDENPNCAKTHATFCLFGDALNPEEVSAALGLAPTRVIVKGQSPRGWLLASAGRVESTSLERHLIHLLGAIEPAAAKLETLRDRDELRAEFFCFWRSATGHGGPELSPGALARIAALDATFGIDFYRA